MKAKWECPNCIMSSTRHWNVTRHIERWHAGLGKPVSDNTRQYPTWTNPQSYDNNPSWPSYFHKSKTFQTHKYRRHKTVDIMEDILEPFRKAVEFKNLLNQLSSPRQESIPSINYSTLSSTNFNLVPSTSIASSNNNLSEPVQTDGREIIAYRGYVCEKCLIPVLVNIYYNKSREIFRSTHDCDPKRLQSVVEEANRDKIFYEMNTKLPEVMRNVVNEWTRNQNYAFASEIEKQQIPHDNCIELNVTHENDWALRAIKYNLTNLNDQELLDFLTKSKNVTFSVFKVHLEYKQDKFSSRYYLIYITNRLNRTPYSFI
jgi:hypothetical protein